jgi:hypothetical protein
MTWYNLTDDGGWGQANGTDEDGIQIFTPSISSALGDVVEFGNDMWYYLYNPMTYEVIDLPSATYNDTVVGYINWADFANDMTYDNVNGGPVINGSFVNSIVLDGYSSTWDGATLYNVSVGADTIFRTGGVVSYDFPANNDDNNTYYHPMATLVGTFNDSDYYYVWDWLAPFYNDTQITYYDTFDNYQFVDFYGSFDFTTDTFGFTFGAAPYQAPQTTTSSVTNISTATEDNNPGFTALVSMLTVGVIAYVAPRMRKKEN